jgi:hypothetical protein
MVMKLMVLEKGLHQDRSVGWVERMRNPTSTQSIFGDVGFRSSTQPTISARSYFRNVEIMRSSCCRWGWAGLDEG